MVRGWRNDPRWVAFYAKRDEDRINRQIKRMEAEFAIAQSQAACDSAFRRMRFRPIGSGWVEC